MEVGRFPSAGNILFEALGEDALDVLLGRLSPRDAARLGSLSTRLRSLVSASSMWERWCYQECPSLTLPPAKENIAAHYGPGKASGFNKLYLKLHWKRYRKLPEEHSRCVKAVGLNDLVVLIDLLAGESIASKTGSFMHLASRALPGEAFTWIPKEGVFRLTVRADANAIEERRLRESLRDWHTAVVTDVEEPKPPAVRMYWRLLRKSDGALSALVDSDHPLNKLNGAGRLPGLSGAHSRCVTWQTSDKALCSSYSIYDADWTRWPDFRAKAFVRADGSFANGNLWFELGIGKRDPRDPCRGFRYVWTSDALFVLKHSMWKEKHAISLGSGAFLEALTNESFRGSINR